MTSSTKFYGWKLLAVLWALMLAASLPMYSEGVIGKYMADALHFDRTTLGSAFSIYVLMTGIPGPLIALCINKKGIRFTLAMGALLMAISAVLMANFVHAIWQVYLVFGLMIGVAVCAAGPIAAQTAAARWFNKRKALAISLLLTGGTICGFIAPPMTNRVIEHFHGDWRSGWWLLAAVNAVAVAVAALFVREKPADLGQFPDGAASEAEALAAVSPGTGRSGVYRTADEWTFGEALRSPVLWLVAFCAIGFCGGFFMFLAHGAAHLKDLGYSMNQAAFSLSFLALIMLCGTLLAGALGDHFDPRLILSGSNLLLGIGLLLAVKASGPLGLYLYAFFLGMGAGGSFTSAMTLPANFFGVKAYASIVGLTAAIGTVVAAVCTFLAGYCYDHYGSYARFLIPVGLLSFAGFLILLFLKPPKRKLARPLTMTAAAKL
jgi:MFS family permease